MGHRIAYGTFVPIAICCGITVIATEASGMDDRDMLPDGDAAQNNAAA